LLLVLVEVKDSLLDLLALTLCSHPSEIYVSNACAPMVIEEAIKFGNNILIGRIQARKYLRLLLDFAQKSGQRQLYSFANFLIRLQRSVEKKVKVGKWHADEYRELEEAAEECLVSCGIDSIITCENKYSIITHDLVRKLKKGGIEVQYFKDLCNIDDVKVALHVKG